MSGSGVSKRVTPDGELTPDVTVTTPAPYARDLVVVEAKDRHRMAVGRRTGGVRGSDQNSALYYAERYAAGLRPAVTWVVNHCDYRYDTDSLTEHGTVWARIRLAAKLGQPPCSSYWGGLAVSSQMAMKWRCDLERVRHCCFQGCPAGAETTS